MFSEARRGKTTAGQRERSTGSDTQQKGSHLQGDSCSPAQTERFASNDEVTIRDGQHRMIKVCGAAGNAGLVPHSSAKQGRVLTVEECFPLLYAYVKLSRSLDA